MLEQKLEKAYEKIAGLKESLARCLPSFIKDDTKGQYLDFVKEAKWRLKN